MKAKLIALVLFGTVAVVNATVTLSTQFGIAYSADGVAVPDGTPWALIVDANNDLEFAGGFGLNSSLVDADSVFTIGQSISSGDIIGSDYVFATGVFNGGAADYVGASLDTVIFELNGAAGVSAGLNFAFYWFPDATIVNGEIVLADEVGGVHSDVDGEGLGYLIIPSDGATVPAGASTTDLGGTLTAAQFTAVQLVPEPSTALLGALGALGLLRRRR